MWGLKTLLISTLCLTGVQCYSINTYNRFAQPALVAKQKLAQQLDDNPVNQDAGRAHPTFPTSGANGNNAPQNMDGHPVFPSQEPAAVGSMTSHQQQYAAHPQPQQQQEGHPVFPSQQHPGSIPIDQNHQPGSIPVNQHQHQQPGSIPVNQHQHQQPGSTPVNQQPGSMQVDSQQYSQAQQGGPLNPGDIVGEKYVLDGDPKISSGKSFIYEAYTHDDNGNPNGEAVIVKLSDNTEALERERENFGRIANCDVSRQLFVQVHDYVAQADPSNTEMDGQAALIMERGEQDLRSYVRTNGPLQGQQLRDAAKAAAKVVRAVHNSDMVWTEIKAANFVVTENQENQKAFGFDVKGIDLESAVPHRDNPIDYSPEACPPEFAVAFLCGREPYVEMDYSFDVWSLGMVFFKLATGTGYFDPEKTDKVDIANALKNGDSIDLNNVHDPLMKDLIEQCLNYDADSRPTIDEVLNHPFFQA